MASLKELRQRYAAANSGPSPNTLPSESNSKVSTAHSPSPEGVRVSNAMKGQKKVLEFALASVVSNVRKKELEGKFNEFQTFAGSEDLAAIEVFKLLDEHEEEYLTIQLLSNIPKMHNGIVAKISGYAIIDFARVLAIRIADNLPDSNALVVLDKGWCIEYIGEQYQIWDDVLVCIRAAIDSGFSLDCRLEIEDVVKIVNLHYKQAVERIRDAGLASLFVGGKSDSSSPPTSRSPGSKRKGGVDLDKMRAAHRTSAKPKMFKSATPSVVDKRYTISIDGKDAVLHFGRHKGKNLGEIVRIDNGYLEWMLKSEQDFPRDICDVIRYILANPLTAKPKTLDVVAKGKAK